MGCLKYEDRPFVSITAAGYGEEAPPAVALLDPTVIPNDKGLGYTVDLSLFGIQALVHIRIDNMKDAMSWSA